MGINSLDELVAIDQLELEDQETSLFKEEDLEEHVDFDNQAWELVKFDYQKLKEHSRDAR